MIATILAWLSKPIAPLISHDYAGNMSNLFPILMGLLGGVLVIISEERKKHMEFEKKLESMREKDNERP